MRANRRVWSWAVAIAACATTSAAQGAVVHRCRQVDGVIAYRDTGCTAGETLVARLEFATPSGPPIGPPVAAAAARQAARSRSSQSSAAAPRGTDEIVAHECRFGEQRWVQAEACPASLASAATRGGKPQNQRVEQTRLTRGQVCGALRGTSTAQSPGAGSARRAYGMNRLRQRHGC